MLIKLLFYSWKLQMISYQPKNLINKILSFPSITVVPDESKSFFARPCVTGINLAFYQFFAKVYE